MAGGITVVAGVVEGSVKEGFVAAGVCLGKRVGVWCSVDGDGDVWSNARGCADAGVDAGDGKGTG